MFLCGFPIPVVFFSPFIWSQWGDGHGSIGLLQALFSPVAGAARSRIQMQMLGGGGTCQKVNSGGGSVEFVSVCPLNKRTRVRGEAFPKKPKQVQDKKKHQWRLCFDLLFLILKIVKNT